MTGTVIGLCRMRPNGCQAVGRRSSQRSIRGVSGRGQWWDVGCWCSSPAVCVNNPAKANLLADTVDSYRFRSPFVGSDEIARTSSGYHVRLSRVIHEIELTF